MKNNIDLDIQINLQAMFSMSLYYTSAILEQSIKMYAASTIGIDKRQYKIFIDGYKDINKKFTEQNNAITKKLEKELLNVR